MKTISRPPLIEALGARLPGQLALNGLIWEQGLHKVPASHGIPDTVLLRMLAGLEPLAMGAIRWNGLDVWQMNADEISARRLRYPFVPRAGGLLPHMTLADNAALPLIYHTREPRERVEHRVGELFERFGVSEWAEKIPGDVPLAIRRRTSLARSLTSTPSVIFLEAPFEGDPDLWKPLESIRTEFDFSVLLTGEVPAETPLTGTLEWTEQP
ncbi:MAG: ATP-binding cassette domain-containing protein [Planctomycetota bacterium]